MAWRQLANHNLPCTQLQVQRQNKSAEQNLFVLWVMLAHMAQGTPKPYCHVPLVKVSTLGGSLVCKTELPLQVPCSPHPFLHSAPAISRVTPELLLRLTVPASCPSLSTKHVQLSALMGWCFPYNKVRQCSTSWFSLWWQFTFCLLLFSFCHTWFLKILSKQIRVAQ